MAEVLDSGPADRFEHEDLARLGVPDVANARTLLGWMGILTGGKHPHPDFLAAKKDGPAALRAFLRDCVRKGYQLVEPTADTSCLDKLGMKELDGAGLSELVESLPPIVKERSRTLRSNYASCLKALHDVILHCDDLVYLNGEAGRPQRRVRPSPNGSASRAWRPAVMRADVGEPITAFSRGVREEISGGLDADPSLAVAEIDAQHHIGSFALDLDQVTGKLVRGHVYIDAPATPERIRALAVQLLGRAEEIQGLDGTPSPAEPAT